MARRRVFVPEIRRGAAELTGRDAEHLVRVLRAEPGQVYELSDNRDLYLAEVGGGRKSLVSFRVLEKLDTPVPGVQVSLLAALIKFEHFEWLIEKATELGVSTIRPIESARIEGGHASAVPPAPPKSASAAGKGSRSKPANSPGASICPILSCHFVWQKRCKWMQMFDCCSTKTPPRGPSSTACRSNARPPATSLCS